MVDEVENELIESAEPMVTWITTKGIDFAVDLIAASVILVVGALCIKLIERAVRKFVERRTSNHELLERFVVSVVSKIAWIVLLVVVAAKLGVDVGPIIAGLGATGFILGFAFQESLGSLAAGIMIAINQPFKLGDFVSIAGHDGTIRHLDMMAVTLTTGDNRRITIPNKQAWGAAIVNYSAMPIRRIEVVMSVSYDSDVAKACALGLETIKSLSTVLPDPAPYSSIKNLGDSSIDISFRAWVNNSDFWPTTSKASLEILAAYAKAGIDVPYNRLDVHMVGQEG